MELIIEEVPVSDNNKIRSADTSGESFVMNLPNNDNKNKEGTE